MMVSSSGVRVTERKCPLAQDGISASESNWQTEYSDSRKRRCMGLENDFLPSASIENLKARAELYQRVRSFFDENHFFEVETPMLSHDTVIDRHIQPIGISKREVTGADADREQLLWLQTSPEFGMKRLIAGGAMAIYQISKAFRQRESGQKHNPEFSMLEWYRVGDDMQSGMAFLADFVETMLSCSQQTKFISYREAFHRKAGLDPFTASVQQLKEYAKDANFDADLSIDEAHRDEFLNVILSTVVEPALGREQPTTCPSRDCLTTMVTARVRRPTGSREHASSSNHVKDRLTVWLRTRCFLYVEASRPGCLTDSESNVMNWKFALRPCGQRKRACLKTHIMMRWKRSWWSWHSSTKTARQNNSRMGSMHCGESLTGLLTILSTGNTCNSSGSYGTSVDCSFSTSSNSVSSQKS